MNQVLGFSTLVLVFIIFQKISFLLINTLRKRLKKLKREIDLERILGPFSILPMPTLRISPIGIVPKQDGTWRLITNLSHPRENSVNSAIDPEFCKVTYSSFDSILEKIHDLGRGTKLAKMDIKSAFRLLPIHPADFDLMGIYFDGHYFIDKCMPMGCAISCNVFEKFATFLHWLVQFRSGLDSLDHYLDDFIFMGESNTGDCKYLMYMFEDTCNKLGVPIAHDKTSGPTTVLTFLGFIIDTELMMVIIPPEKLKKLHEQLKW